MKRLFISFLMLMFLISLAACGGDSSNSRTNVPLEPPDLSGQWKQVSNESKDGYYGAIISEDKIEIYWVSNDNTRALYWAGSFVSPSTAEEPYSWVSQNDTAKTSRAILASNDDTKAFTYIDGQISYSASIMGITATIHMEKTEWESGLEIEENTEQRTQSGFDALTNQTITLGGVKFYFPAYYDVPDKNSTDGWIAFYSYSEEIYNFSMLVFRAEDSDNMSLSQEQFDNMKAEMADSVLETLNQEVTQTESVKATIAGLSGWKISFRGLDDESLITGNIAFAFNPENQMIISVMQVNDQKDISIYDYMGDFQKIIETAELITAPDRTPSQTTSSGIRQEFKEAMDSYEEFFDEYIAFMKKFESDASLSMLTDYANYMSKCEDTMSKLDAINEDELTPEELSYYTEVMLRINQKILGVLQ